MADPHLGSWNNHPDMREYPLLAFKEAISVCINSAVDFIIISGDLFDSSIPPIDILRFAVSWLKRCKDAGINIYAIPGSHDFSPTGKTMLSVLEDAGLIVNVARCIEVDGKLKLKFVNDKSGARIAGMLGRRGGLEKSYYESLESPENYNGLSIFVFHSAITEYKPQHLKEMDSISLSLLPKNFNYYAGGHVHHKFERDEEFGKIVYPGALFPTSFDELEKCKPGFYFVNYDGKINLNWFDLNIIDVVTIEINADKKSVKRVEDEILNKIEHMDLKNKIFLLKISGVLENGKPSDIDFKTIYSKVYQKGAKVVKKNISMLTTKEFEEIKIKPNVTVEELEKTLIAEHTYKLSKFSNNEIKKIILDLMNTFKEEKMEGETNTTYEERIKSNVKKILGV